jgi:Domain of unknown function (DUF397)
MNERKSSHSNPSGACIEVGQGWRETKRKSTRCNHGECIEVGQETGVILVGDTKDPAGAKLAVRSIEWEKFLTRVRNDGRR